MTHMSFLAKKGFPSVSITLTRSNNGRWKSLTKTNVPSSGLHEMKTILFLTRHQHFHSGPSFLCIYIS